MRKISKQAEPDSLTRWKRANPNGTYQDLSHIERQDIRTCCLQEQFYLCAYCSQALTGESNGCMNEHVQAREIAPNRSVDFTNIVASCITAKQCDKAHGSQPLPLTPFMDECESELKFKISGRVEGLTPRAIETIRVLNLGDTEKNNKALIDKRKQLSQVLLWTNGINPDDGLDDDELIKMAINDINQPQSGKLDAFTPVVTNILRGWLRKSVAKPLRADENTTKYKTL